MLRDLTSLGRQPHANCSHPHDPLHPRFRQPEPHEADRFSPSDRPSRSRQAEAPAPAEAPARKPAPERPAPPPAPVTLLAELPAPPALAPPAASGVDPADLDPSVRPQADFYQYATGGWQARHPIPPEQPRRGTFSELHERNRKVVHDILVDLASRTDLAPGSDEQKLADFYASGMDTAAIEAAGARPLQPLFDRIQAISSLQDLQSTAAWLHGMGIPSMFAFGSGQDFQDSTKVIGEAFQGGLGLPERDYYFDKDEKSQGIRQAYRDHVARMFGLLGEAPEEARAHAETVMALETRMAAAAMSRTEMRDPAALYHPMDRGALAELTPHLDWPRYFADRGRPELDSINVASPKYLQALDGLLAEVPLEDWKAYMRWHVINATASYLSKDFDEANFDFKGRTLTGVQEQQPRWKRVAAATDGALGEALGRKFVERTFTPESRARVREMIANIQMVLREDLEALPWMGDATRAEALAKLEAFSDKIGYPDRWKDYSGLQVDRGVFVENVLRADRFAVNEDLGKIGLPVDRSEWGMSPATVNAYYHPLMNEIVFPAGILQPPFFDPAADDAVNYGAIGMVMGHELTHGFDDQGSQFDARGNLRNWWTPEDRERFEARAGRIVAQADAYEVQPGLHLKGPLVVGEALADQGGVELAYAAWKRAQRGKPQQVLGGFTPEQRFFLGLARVWAQNSRPEYERLQVTTDPHPVNRFRVNNTLANFPPFQEAFGLRPGDPLYRPPEERAQLWWPDSPGGTGEPSSRSGS